MNFSHRLGQNRRKVTFWVFRMCTGLAALIVLFYSPASRQIAAAGGTLDTTFGTGGRVTTHFGGNERAMAVAVQSDGKIVVAGSSQGVTPPDFVVSRYNVNGSLDTSFDGDGKVTTDVLGFLDFAEAIVVQPDGKIVVAGIASTSFQGGNRFALVRYNTNGSLDTDFGTGGKVTTAFPGALNSGAFDIAIQPNGKIVAVGSISDAGGDRAFTALARYEGNGSLDTGFGTAGTGLIVLTSGAGFGLLTGVAVQSDGKIVVGGSSGATLASNPDFMVSRLDVTGRLDPTFGTNGMTVADFSGGNDLAHDIALQSDGKIVAVGFTERQQSSDFAMMRCNAGGALDTSFGNGGKVITEFGSDGSTANGVVIQTDGKIVTAGFSIGSTIGAANMVLARHNSDGGLDTSFGTGGRVTTDFNGGGDQAEAVALQSDGKIIAVGVTVNTQNFAADFALVRYLSTEAAPRTPFDYDGDGRADISIYRPSIGDWYVQRSRDGLFGIRFGLSTDRITPADFDGDGRTDVAVYRPSDGTWYIVRSTDGTFMFAVFGLANDLPIPGDFDGDGRADISVFRPSDSTWYRLNSSNGSFFGRQFGAPGDKPVMGDFDGDGRADLAVFRPSAGTWFQIRSQTDAFFGEQFGISTDQVVPADYDGDRRTDLAVYRASNGFWYIKPSLTGAFSQTPFGLSTDIPAPADYDGDGRADICVFRPSEGQWYRLNSSNGMFNAFPFGFAGDRPTQSAFQ